MKKVKTILALLLATLFIFSACSGNSGNTGNGETAEGGGNGDNIAPTAEHYTVYASEWPALNYLTSANVSVREAYALLISGFVQYDKYGHVQPDAATHWEVSEDGLTWTFHLRDGLKWYDCNGQEVGDVVADDFVAAAEYVLDVSHNSKGQMHYTDNILNAKEYYNQEITDFSQVGVKALDEKTVEYTLSAPVPYFLSVVSNMSYLPVNRSLLEETGDRFATSKETLYTSGAYYLSGYEPENIHVFTYNPGYWAADTIHIAQITQIYNKEANSIGTELFMRGEITATSLPDVVLDEYMNDPEKSQYVVESTPAVTTASFLFNYAVPNLEAEYEPENWNAAINNKAFRKAIFHAVDRVACASTINSYIAEDIVTNTISVRSYLGPEYSDLAPIKELTETEMFDPELALEYKQQAMEELEGVVTFPVKVAFAYNTGSASSSNQVQVFKQQVERVLGTDFIVVEPVGFASTGFNAEVVTAGKFCMVVSSAGPTVRDPSTPLGMFTLKNKGNSPRYGSMHLATEYIEDNGLTVYENMYNAACDERMDIEKRWQMFADAEYHLITEALTMPYYQSSYGYQLTYIQPFSFNRLESGASTLKGAIMQDEQVTREQYDTMKEADEAEKAALVSEK